jgi:phenylpyruvate tautomerase PptA (4-oxalocrotonate tautomerase family)
MPLIRFDLIKGRTEKEIADLLDAAHEAMLAAFHVPVRDRYQIVQEHEASRLRIEDTGLGLARTGKVVIVQVTSRPRTTEEKQTFYRLLCETLQKKCGIAPSDVMVSIVENTDADWSFGNGEAQFLTGKLGASARLYWRAFFPKGCPEKS